MLSLVRVVVWCLMALIVVRPPHTLGAASPTASGVRDRSHSASSPHRRTTRTVDIDDTKAAHRERSLQRTRSLHTNGVTVDLAAAYYEKTATGAAANPLPAPPPSEDPLMPDLSTSLSDKMRLMREKTIQFQAQLDAVLRHGTASQCVNVWDCFQAMSRCRASDAVLTAKRYNQRRGAAQITRLFHQPEVGAIVETIAERKRRQAMSGKQQRAGGDDTADDTHTDPGASAASRQKSKPSVVTPLPKRESSAASASASEGRDGAEAEASLADEGYILWYGEEPTPYSGRSVVIQKLIWPCCVAIALLAVMAVCLPPDFLWKHLSGQ